MTERDAEREVTEQARYKVARVLDTYDLELGEELQRRWLATDETVALAETVGENGDELQDALETLLVLQRSGTLDELAELAEVGSLATAALDDEMVTSLAGTGAALGEVAQTAADDDTRDGIETLLAGLGEAEREPAEPVGPVGLLRGLRDPDVQYGLGYLLALAGAVGRERAERETE